MLHTPRHTLVLFLALLASPATPVAAQYDRDGRYVPSPMGVPTDPYARPVPMHPGTPGGAVGEPIWPRGSIPTNPQRSSGRLPERETPAYTQSSRARAYYRAFKLCSNKWTEKSGISRAEHNRRCREQLED